MEGGRTFQAEGKTDMKVLKEKELSYQRSRRPAMMAPGGGGTGIGAWAG